MEVWGWSKAVKAVSRSSFEEGDDPFLGLDRFGVQLTEGVVGPVELSYRVLDSAPLGMAIMDPSGRFQWANAAACAVLGRSRGDLLSVGVSEIVHPDDLAAESAALAQLLKGERSSTQHEIRCLRADGSVIWVSASISVPTGPEGSALLLGPQRMPALVLQILDITDRKVIEAALAEAREQLAERNAALESSNRDLDEVATILSHDLAEPLRVIAGHVTLLANRYGEQLDADALGWIDFAVDGCKRMKALIDAVLAYSRVGQVGPPAEPADSASIVGNAVRDMADLIESSGAVVTVEGDLPPVPVVPAEFSQIVANLIANALRHGSSSAEPRIVIRGTTQRSEYRFEVEDNGPGIPARHRERVFRPLQRLNRPTDGPGTGIGLAICRRAVERAGGRIGTAEPPSGGAVFWFTIPRRNR